MVSRRCRSVFSFFFAVVIYCGFPGFDRTRQFSSREFLLGITKDGLLGDIDDYAFVLLHVDRWQALAGGLPFSLNDGLDEKAEEAFDGSLIVNYDYHTTAPEWMERFKKTFNNMFNIEEYMVRPFLGLFLLSKMFVHLILPG